MKRFCSILIVMILCVSTICGNVLAVSIQVKGDPSVYEDIEGHWAYDSISFVIKNGYFKGITLNEFEPETNMSRAMLVTVLWRLTGESLSYQKTEGGVTKTVHRYVNMFWDMKDDDWFTDYVAWANKNDIISGYSKREFRPNEPVTREQLATILYNYLKNYKLVRNLNTLQVREEVTFVDDALISEWAKEKVYMIQKIGLMEGRADGTFDPQATVTRAEIAVVIERLTKI